MDIAPALFPGPDEADLDGCEDPTVIAAPDGLSVWYTGYNEQQKMGRLMLARGASPNLLEKHGVVLESTDRFKNPKGATIVWADNGWRIFFEYARDDASLIGEARTGLLNGVWRDRSEGPIKPRKDKWDSWHLSPGPVIGERSDTPVMFYNGATKDAQWRITAYNDERNYPTRENAEKRKSLGPADVEIDNCRVHCFVFSCCQGGSHVPHRA